MLPEVFGREVSRLAGGEINLRLDLLASLYVRFHFGCGEERIVVIRETGHLHMGAPVRDYDRGVLPVGCLAPATGRRRGVSAASGFLVAGSLGTDHALAGHAGDGAERVDDSSEESRIQERGIELQPDVRAIWIKR